MLKRAAHKGLEIAESLVKEFTKKPILQNKFRTLYYALNIGNPPLRWQLLEEDEADQLKVKTFVHMEEKDLASNEHKQNIQKQLEFDMQAKRTDAVLSDMLANGTTSSLYSCIRCKGRQVSMYT